MMESRHLDVLDEAHKWFSEKNPELLVFKNESYLDVWKRPLPPKNGTVFLPSFHLVIMVASDEFALNLCAFNGKILRKETTPMSAENLEQVSLIRSLADEKFRVCSGISNLDLDWWTDNFLKKNKVSYVVQKIRRSFLLETFYDQTIIRSKLCKYLVYNSTENSVACEECSRFCKSRLRFESEEFDNGFNCNVEDSESIWVSVKKPDEEEELIKLEPEDTKESVMNDVNDYKDPDDDKGDDSLMNFEKEEMHKRKRTNGEKSRPKRKKRFSYQQYQCKICQKAVKSEESASQCMEKHLDNGNLSKPASCPICETKFESRLDIPEHFHDNHQPNTCCWECLMVFSNDRHAHEKHMIELHYHQKGVGGKSVRNSVTPTRLQCKICMLIFKVPSMLLKCMARHEEALDLKKPMICPICNEEIESKLNVTDHFERVHNQEMKTCCCECGLVIENTYGTLRKHILAKHHKAEKAHLCCECGQEYHSKAGLESHIGQVHSKITNFICQHCGDVFAHRLNYKRHLKRHDPKDLKCLHCEKTFRRRRHLFNHLQMHTKLKPFKCRDCEYSSERKGNVSLHVEKMHGRKWCNKDIIVNEDEAERMKKTATSETRQIMASRESAQ